MELVYSRVATPAAGAGIQQAGGAMHVYLAHLRRPRRPVGRAPGKVADRLDAAQRRGQRGGNAEIAGRQFDLGAEDAPRPLRVAYQAAHAVAALHQGVCQRRADLAGGAGHQYRAGHQPAPPPISTPARNRHQTAGRVNAWARSL